MELIDIYYRAFKEYRNKTKSNKVCEQQLKDIISSCSEENSFKSKKFLCTIQEDWVKEIETQLEFVAKAVDEQRQFIISQGEVVEISKVRKVSKDSVAHLAKHANMITHLPEDEKEDDIVPDKLYMVEKLADFAIYENRFLYMMLIYTKNFIDFRLKKINELHQSYEADLNYKNESKTKTRKFSFDLKVHDERKDNIYPIKDSKCEEMLQRINDCLTQVNSLLDTDLMVQVSKAPMLKPPITKTNVLKMNNNFKRSLALYNFLANYEQPGFTYEEVVNDMYPLPDDRAYALAEVTQLVKSIEVEYGNDISELLENRYQKQLQLEKEEESKKMLEQLARLKKQALESGRSLEEYMLLLEKRNKMLEKENEQLAVLRKQIQDLQDQITALNEKIDELTRNIERLQKDIEEKIAEIDRLNQKYIDDMAAIKKAHAEEVATLVRVHNDEVNSLRDDYENQIKDLTNDYETQIYDLNEKYDTDMADLKEKYASERKEIIDKYETKIEELNAQVFSTNELKAQMKKEYDEKLVDINKKLDQAIEDKTLAIKQADEKVKELETEYKKQASILMKETDAKVNKAEEEKNSALAQLHAIEIDTGIMKPGVEYSEKDTFNQLFAEYEAFERFLSEQWNITKGEIKKRIFNAQAAKYDESRKEK